MTGVLAAARLALFAAPKNRGTEIRNQSPPTISVYEKMK
jgi:hypothetical protein